MSSLDGPCLAIVRLLNVMMCMLRVYLSNWLFLPEKLKTTTKNEWPFRIRCLMFDFCWTFCVLLVDNKDKCQNSIILPTRIKLETPSFDKHIHKFTRFVVKKIFMCYLIEIFRFTWCKIAEKHDPSVLRSVIIFDDKLWNETLSFMRTYLSKHLFLCLQAIVTGDCRDSRRRN